MFVCYAMRGAHAAGHLLLPPASASFYRCVIWRAYKFGDRLIVIGIEGVMVRVVSAGEALAPDKKCSMAMDSMIIAIVQSLCLVHTGKPTGVAVSHCITWFQTQLILTMCQICYHAIVGSS